MGAPAMSASGLFGRRVEAKRAGTRTMVRDDWSPRRTVRTNSLLPIPPLAVGPPCQLDSARPPGYRPDPSAGRVPVPRGVLAATSKDRSPYGRVTRRQQDRGGNPDRRHHRAGCGGLLEDTLLASSTSRRTPSRSRWRRRRAERAKPAPEKPLPVLLAAADPKAGERDAGVCKACHNLAEGAGSKIGPDLWNVVGRDIASKADFSLLGRPQEQEGQVELTRTSSRGSRARVSGRQAPR